MSTLTATACSFAVLAALYVRHRRRCARHARGMQPTPTGSEQVDVLYHLGVSSDDPAVEGFSDTKFVVMSGTQERAKCVVWGHAGEHSLRCHRDLAVVDADHH